jgi:hypothetical protein
LPSPSSTTGITTGATILASSANRLLHYSTKIWRIVSWVIER